MNGNHYYIHPSDIASFILQKNLPRAEAIDAVKWLFQNASDDLEEYYSYDLKTLVMAVDKAAALSQLSEKEISETDRILQELECEGLTGDEAEHSMYVRYFQFVRLQLLLSDCTYRKLKLRTLMNKFGFKRRTQQRIDWIRDAIIGAGLQTYLRGGVACTIEEINLDDTVILRLKNVT